MATGPAQLTRTLAYVDNSCREDASSATLGAQTLRVRRGEGDAIAVKQLPEVGPFTADGSCRLLGLGRFGLLFMAVGGFQRLAVTPDGSKVVFEVTDAFGADKPMPLPETEKGLFVVNADGSGMRRLANASRHATFRAFLLDNSPVLLLLPDANFSPDGRLLAYSDLGPGPDGDTVQIFTLDVISGERRQLTHLPFPPNPEDDPPSCCPHFTDQQTLTFPTVTNIDGNNPEGSVKVALVGVDGSNLHIYDNGSIGIGQVVPQFSITSTHRSPVLFAIDRPDGSFVREVYLLQDDQRLQLTNFGRDDTSYPLLSSDGQRVLFVASADPLQANPSANCQLFSIDVTGGDLRQITDFSDGAASVNGCLFSSPPGCALGIVGQDASTGSIVTYSNCNPLGENPFGAQLFALRPDGSGLRQLTQARGFVVEADGSVVTELPGPFAYSTR